MRYLISFVLLVVAYSGTVSAFAGGAGTCDVVADYSTITAMGGRTRNPNSGTYTMTSNTSFYNSTDPVEITINGPTFTGIMMEVVDENGNKVGSFDTNDNQVRDCAGGAMALTHTNQHGNVMERTVFWVPPAEPVGNVYVLAYVLSGTRGNIPSQEFFRFVRDDDSALSIEPQGEGSDFLINQGIAGAWFFPETAGSGLMIDVNPANNLFFAAWFTYEQQESTKTVSSPDNRWLTATGPYKAGSAMELPVFQTSGGFFDNPQDVAIEQVGTMNFEFTDCNTGNVSYSLNDGELTGEFPIQRAIPGTQALCESINESAQ